MANWPNSTTLASNERPSRRPASMLTGWGAVEKKTRKHDKVKSRNQRGFKWLAIFKEYQFWKQTTSRTFKNVLNMFHEDLSRQTELSDTETAVFRKAVYCEF